MKNFLIMESFKKLKLFPERWYKKMDESIGRVHDLDVGIMEVGSLSFL